MKARALLTIAVGAALISSCDVTAPFHALNAPQPVGELQFDDFSTGPTSLPSATTMTLTVAMYDKGQNLIPDDGRTIEWKTSDATIATVTGTQVTAVVEGKKAGTATITATNNGHSVTRQVEVIPGAAAKIAKVSGDNQTGIVGQQLPASLVVQVTDANDNNVATNAALTWRLNSGTAQSGSTNATGLGSATVTVPSTPGAGTVTAALTGTSESVTFNLIGTTMELGIVTGPPATADQGIPVNPSPVIELRYASDHLPYKRSGIVVTASRQGTTGPTVTGSATSDANGRATFTNLTLSGSAGSATIVFSTSSPAATITAAAPTTLAAGAATALVLTSTLNAATITGTPLPTAPVLQLRDAGGNNVAQSGVQVTASVNGSGVTIAAGTSTTTTDAAGKATFSALALSGTLGSSFTLTFSSGAMAPATSGTITLTGQAASLFVTGSSSVSCGATSAITVQVRDAGGRSVPLANLSITATISSGATLGGTTTATTDATGKATFNAMTFQTPTAGSYTLTFTPATSSGLPSAQATVDISGGTASKLKVTTEPSATVAIGAAMAQVPVVRIVDGCDLPVSSAGITVTVSSTTGTVTFTPATAITNSSGIATFTGLKMTGAVSANYKLQFAATGLTSATAAANTALTAGPAAALGLTTQPPTAAIHQVVLGTAPVVQVTDAGGNPVAMAGVSVTASPSAGSVSAGSPVFTDANGKATFSSLALSGAGQQATLSFTASSNGFTAATASAATTIATALSKNVAATIPVTASGASVVYGVAVTGATATPLTFTVTNATSISFYTKVGGAPAIPADACTTTGTTTKVCTINTPTNAQYFITLVPSATTVAGTTITVTW
jgi:hypothetical protein